MLNQNAQTVLKNLRGAAESDNQNGYWMVYLDNARNGMDDKVFRAQLAVLSKAGLYKVVDGYAWGEVKLDE